MGSSYITCAITNLPILEDEEVKVVIVRRNNRHIEKRGSGFSNPDDNYRPVTLPFNALADDYGRIKDLDELGESELRRINPQALDEDFYSTNKAIDYIGRQSYDDYGLYVVRRDIYEELLNRYRRADEYEYTLADTREHLHQLILKEWRIPKRDELSTEAEDLIVFNYILGILRRSWEVPTGAGSQDRDYDFHKVLAEYILGVTVRELEGYED